MWKWSAKHFYLWNSFSNVILTYFHTYYIYTYMYISVNICISIDIYISVNVECLLLYTVTGAENIKN